MDNQSNSANQLNENKYPVTFIVFLVICLLLVVGYIGYNLTYGSPNKTDNSKKVITSISNNIAPISLPQPSTKNNLAVTGSNLPTPMAQTTPDAVTCNRYGFAQKWEFLTAYTIQNGDTLQSIAQNQLHDTSRVNEIIQLNGQQQLIVGETIYLPPPNILKSNGNISQVYGVLVDKNSSFWHISFSNDPNGLGIELPSYWFDNIPNAASYAIGSCLKILFDNGDTVYTVSKQ